MDQVKQKETFFINFLDELDHSKTSGRCLFFWPKILWNSRPRVLCHIWGAATPGEGKTWRQIGYCYTFLSIKLSIFEPKHGDDRSKCGILVYWYIGISVYWYIGILVYWSGFLTCSDRHRDWAQTSLARWIKRYSNTRYCPRCSLLREYRRSKSGKVNFFLKKNGPSQKKWNFFYQLSGWIRPF